MMLFISTNIGGINGECAGPALARCNSEWCPRVGGKEEFVRVISASIHP